MSLIKGASLSGHLSLPGSIFPWPVLLAKSLIFIFVLSPLIQKTILVNGLRFVIAILLIDSSFGQVIQ